MNGLSSMGFKKCALVNRQYGLDIERPEERAHRNLGVTISVYDSGRLRVPFFAVSAVKSIGETHHSSIASRSAEVAATRGSCGNQEVKA